MAVAPSEERTRFLRPGTLVGVEALHATFVVHRYVAHIHDTLTVAYVDRGAATFEVEGERHVAAAGNAFLIPPHAVHTGEPATRSGYTYRVLYLDPHQLAVRSDEIIMGAALSRVPTVVRDSNLAVALQRMHGALALDGHSLERGEALAAVAAGIGRFAGLGRPARPAPEHPAVRSARDYIHEHWRQDFSVDDLAAAAGLSPFHLARMFRVQVGMAPSSYRRVLRVQAAQRLLQTGQPLAAVAIHCGFYDQAHLNRHFKRVVGVTPGQYAAAGRRVPAPYGPPGGAAPRIHR